MYLVNVVSKRTVYKNLGKSLTRPQSSRMRKLAGARNDGQEARLSSFPPTFASCNFNYRSRAVAKEMLKIVFGGELFGNA